MILKAKKVKKVIFTKKLFFYLFFLALVIIAVVVNIPVKLQLVVQMLFL